jgi:hypothetical protein
MHNFVKSGFNWVTDKKSSSMLIYSNEEHSIYTQIGKLNEIIRHVKWQCNESKQNLVN